MFELILLIVGLALDAKASTGEGGGPGDNPETCVRGGIIPC